MVGFMSAAGLVGFLSESDPELQIFALRSANENINSVWTEFAAAIPQMYALSLGQGTWSSVVVGVIHFENTGHR